MNQSRIKQLLEEAGAPDCDAMRYNHIWCELEHASATDGGVDEADSTSGPAVGLSIAVGRLLLSAWENDQRAALPRLFPVFALICGDKGPDDLVANIDWTIFGE